MNALSSKPLIWIGSSRDDLREFPEEVRGLMGHALFMAQCGLKHEQAKPLKGYGDAGVLEIVESFASDAYRAVYTVRLAAGSTSCMRFRRNRNAAAPRQRPISTSFVCGSSAPPSYMPNGNEP